MPGSKLFCLSTDTPLFVYASIKVVLSVYRYATICMRQEKNIYLDGSCIRAAIFGPKLLDPYLIVI